MRFLLRRNSRSSSCPSEWESCHDCSWHSDPEDCSPESLLLVAQADSILPTASTANGSTRFARIRSRVRFATYNSSLRHDDRSGTSSKPNTSRSSSFQSLTSIFSRSSSSHTSTSEQKLKEALPELKPKPLETYDTPALRRIADGKFSIKVKLVLVGLKLYAWLQRQAGWDEVDPPVQVYKNGKFVKPEDWSPELKKKYGYIGRMVV